MKNRFGTALFAALICLLTFIPANAQNSRITLSDGTVINGQVTGMANGVYTIETTAMGILSINADSVVSISNGAASEQHGNSNNYKSGSIDIIDGSKKQSYSNQEDDLDAQLKSNEYSSMQNQANQKVQSMMMKGDFLDSMMGLSESSNMTDVMNDPEIMDAINRGDYDYLMNNSKMQNLMDSSEIQDLLGGM